MLSVRLLTYNHAAFIGRAMEGILKQKTSFPVEVIVGDDFSTDKTLEIIRSFDEVPNITITILQRDKNGVYGIERAALGRMYNFVDTLTHCKGTYIALLDGDDYWEDPHKLQQQVDFLEENKEYVISFHNVSLVDEKERVLDRDFLKSSEKIRTTIHLFSGAILPTSSVVFRAADSYPENFVKVKNGDTFLFAYLANYGKAYFQTELQNGCYRIHSKGVFSGSDYHTNRTYSLITFQEIIKITPKKHLSIVYKKLASITFTLFKNSKRWVNKVNYGYLCIVYGCSSIWYRIFK